MSRIGKKPILIPKGVEVKTEGRKISVKGPKGELYFVLPEIINIEINEDKISLNPEQKTKKSAALWGTSRAILANNVKGVTEGYEKKLQIDGLGYRAQVEGQNLVLQVGFTHPVKIEAPAGIKFSVEANIISVTGADKEVVGQTAAKVRQAKEPDQYKGKGIRYLGEFIRKKAGKKVVATK